MKPRVIAIHLPQFHPFKENDEWWGKGFTEWRNVAKARPRFPGHYQPHLPADLGFYDLRVPETRVEQAQMARDHGIYGFCYYHYWFNGKLLMERPLEDMLKSNIPDFPFMLCWANENWTRVWDGGEKQILIEQNYSEEDDQKHIKYLIKYFKDQRYIRVNNKPVLCIYRSALLPDIENTIKIWRTEALKENIELYICRFESMGESGEKYMINGIDAAIDFPPHDKERESKKYKYFVARLINKISQIMIQKKIIPIVEKYKKYIKSKIKRPYPIYKWYPCVTPMWDNSPRRKGMGFFAFKGSTPELFGLWLRKIIEKFVPYSSEENFIFINAWNEWAEGNHLEPDLKWGKKYLDEIKKVMVKD